MSCPDEDKIALFKTAVLSEKRDYLCTNITRTKSHYPYLRSRYVLSEEDEELIELQQTRRQKVHKMVDILVTKGSKGFDELVRSLIQERTQLFVAQELNKAFEDKKKRQAILASSEATGHVLIPTVVNGVDPSQKTDSTSLRTSGTYPITVTEPNRSSVSDLGVDTDKLPKPQMQKSLSQSMNDSLRKSGELLYVREKSIEENEDKSSRARSISSSSSV